MNPKLIATILVLAAILAFANYAKNISANPASPSLTAEPAINEAIPYSEYTLGEDGKLYKPGETPGKPQEGY